MKEYNIEAYLEGGMSEKDRIAFKKEMDCNPTFKAEVDNFRIIKEDLESIALSNQIKKALSESKESPPSAIPIKKLILFLVVCLVGAIVFIKWFKESMIEEETAPSIEIEKETPTDTNKQSPELEKKTPIQKEIKREKQKSENLQFAQAEEKETPKQKHTTSEFRGENYKPDDWKTFVDSIWYSEYLTIEMLENSKLNRINTLLEEGSFSKAYARIQLLERRALKNDTLSIMKGYCLLEMKRGSEALKSFEQIKEPAWSQHIQWYTTLGYLLSSDVKNAEALFDQISKDTNHHFYNQSIKKQKELQVLYKE